MSLSSLLPPPVTRRYRALRSTLREVRASLRSSRLPVARQRHTPEELEALRAQAARDRARRLGGRPRGSTTEPLRAEFRDLEIRDLARETDDAIRIVLGDDPTRPWPRRHAGEYLTVIVEIDGVEHRRAYSICSPPQAAGRVEICVKRLPGGRVSDHLHTQLRVGARLRTLGPSGRFVWPPPGAAPPHDAPLRLLAGGSGITPLIAILRAALAAGGDGPIDLVYVNRRRRDIIFADALADLERRHDRLTITQVLTRPDPGSDENTGGRPDRARLAHLLPADPAAHYYLCGPGGLRDLALTQLREAGVPAAHVHIETFFDQGSADARAIGQRAARSDVLHSVRFARSGRLLHVRADQTLLEAGRLAGLPLLFSCTMGGCAACKVRVLEGEVEMAEPNCLSAAERDAGACLACVAEPRGPLVIDA